MTNQNSNKNRQLDNQLADFTDMLLNQNAGSEIEVESHNQELLELQKTVLRLAHAFEDEAINETVTRRIKSGLLAEWPNTIRGKTKKRTQQPWWERIFSGFPSRKSFRNRRAYGLAYATLAAILIFVVLSIFFPEFVTGNHLTGTALGEGIPLQALLTLGIIVVGLVVYWLFQRKN